MITSTYPEQTANVVDVTLDVDKGWKKRFKWRKEILVVITSAVLFHHVQEELLTTDLRSTMRMTSSEERNAGSHGQSFEGKQPVERLKKHWS